MEMLFSALIGGVSVGLGVAIFQLLVKDPVKRKKFQVVGMIPAILLITTFNSNPPFKYKLMGLFDRKYAVYGIIESKFGVVLKDERVVKQMEGGNEHAKAYAFILGQQGIKHLELVDLLKWNDLRIKISENSEPFCAGLFNGNVTEDVVINAMGTLSDTDLEAFSDLMTKGAFRKLNGEGDPDTHMSFLQEAIRDISNGLAPSDQKRFMATASDPRAASETDACWSSLQLLNGVKKMSGEKQGKVLKALAGI